MPIQQSAIIVKKGQNKMELKNEELSTIYGGAISINATFLNAASRLITTILDLGRAIGSSIRRYKTGKYCE